MKSWKRPTPETVNRTVALLGHKEQIRYFFDKLENPEWIKPLEAKGFFVKPPEPQRDEERGTIGFPPWPELRYLMRMAPIKPDTVLEVVCKIPDDHGNIRVYEDLVDVALHMPPNLSVMLTEKAKLWAQSPYQMFLADKIGELIGYLAEGEQIDAALDLASVLLEVLPDPKYQAKRSEDSEFRLPPDLNSRCDEWQYEEILKKKIPKLWKVDGIRTIQLLCDLLNQAVFLSQEDEKERQNYEDYSYIWRPAIEDHSQNRRSGIRFLLVSSIRNAIVNTASTDPSSVPIILQVLESHKWKVFHRLGLYLLKSFGSSYPELVEDRLSNREMFNDYGVRHEYASLLGEYFGQLNQEHQETILKWINEGPDVDRFIESRKEWTSKQPTDEEINRYCKTWQRDRLSWFKSHLSDDLQKTYKELVDEFGEPDHPDFSSYGSSWTGPTSPKDADELKSMTVPEIVNYLKNWVPPDEHFASSPEGLARVLSSVVKQDPDRFVNQADMFKDLEPTYVRALFWGLRDSYGENKEFKWDTILDLCNWIVKQPRELPPKQYTEAGDSNWGHVRKSIADLLSNGFDNTPGHIPIELREIVWAVLRPLTDDPDPTPDAEARHFEFALQHDSVGDPANYSINTTRGEALHSVIRYALWIRRHLEKLPDSKEQLLRGFDEMPEVKEVLEIHLDISHDPSLAIRAVYGQWFPWLVLLDTEWASSRASDIFPVNESSRSHFFAAWETYIVYCRPYDNVYDLLIEQYKLAVSEITPSTDIKKDDHCFDMLAEHLMTFYWRGKLNLDEPEGTLFSFWDKGSPRMRGHALAFIGQSLCNTVGSVPEDVLNRFSILWEKRLEIAKASESVDNFKTEIKAFGLWFISGKFEGSWAMSQLLEALSITGEVERCNKVIEKLVETVQEMPKETVKCIELIAKGDREGWRAHGSRKEIKIILDKALKTDAATYTERVIHYLGNRGYFEFLALLSKD